MVILLSSLLLAGCEDDKKPASPEEARNIAFIGFLQKDVLDSAVLSLPPLTAEQRQAFGPFAADYEIITGFHNSLSEAMDIYFPQIMGQMQRFETLPNLQRNWQAVFAVRNLLNTEVKGSLDRAYQSALASRQRLQQPDSVKTVFDKVFVRSVEKPTASVRELLQILDESLDIMENMGSFLDDNKEHITFSGILVRAKTPAMQQELDTLMKEFNFRADALQKQLAIFRGQLSRD